MSLPRLQTIFVIPLVIVAALGAVSILPQKNYHRPENISALQQQVKEINWRQLDWNTIFDIRFQGFGNGDLRNLGALNYSGRTVLKVSDEVPETRYLHSFVGASLGGEGWNAVSEKEYQQAAAAFPDLVPQRLSEMLSEFGGEGSVLWDGAQFSPVTKAHKITVRNVATPRGMVFLPSFLQSASAENGPVKFFNDAQADVFGAEQYTLNVRSKEKYSVCSQVAAGGQIESMRLSVMHNLWFYNTLMEKIRAAIEEDRFEQFYAEYFEKLDRRI